MTTANNTTAEPGPPHHQQPPPPGVDARSRILNAAITQFGQHGFDTDLQSIADAAGVAAQAVIDEFGSADGLLTDATMYDAFLAREDAQQHQQS